MQLELIAGAVLGYLLGSLPTGYLIGRIRGIDIRKWGSGATGGTNVYRTLGVGAAITTGITDLLKGTAAAYAGYRIGGEWGYALAGVAAALGHSYPVWLRFRGGKSVATGVGALILRYPVTFAVALAAALAALIPTRFVSLGSLVGALVYGAGVWLFAEHPAHRALAAGAILVVYVRHWENMKRLAAGTENKFGQSARPREGRG